MFSSSLRTVFRLMLTLALAGLISGAASAATGPQLTGGVEAAVGSSWQTVNLPATYSNAVIVATPSYSSSDAPAVARVRNVTGTSFQLRVDNPSGSSLSGYRVYWVAAEAGSYTVANDGIKMEAATFSSNVTDENGSWVGQSRSYQQSYTAPVVLGQVQSANDADWSVFWARGTGAKEPPSSSSLFVGKNVSEDPDVTRANETIGYMVIEAGNYTVAGREVLAQVGADSTVFGITDGAPFTYTLSGLSSAATGALSTAGMNGANGGWPVFYGTSPLSVSAFDLAFDEDQLNDSERAHTDERVAYLILGDAPAANQAPVAESGTHPNVNTGTLVQLDGSASSDPDSGPQALSYSWSQTGGAAVSLSGANTATPSFTPAVADTYSFELTVSDGADQASDTVSVVVTASSGGDIVSGLIAHWPFDGSTTDASGNGRTASLQNGPGYVAGQFGQALQLDGNNDYAIVGPGTTGFLHDAFSTRTLALWVLTTGNSGERVLIEEGGTTNGIALRLNGGSLEVATRNGSVQATATAAYPNDGAWHHVAASFDNGALRLYLDGVQVGQATASYTTVGNHSSIGLLGGADSDAFGAPGGGVSDYLNGACDEVRVYDRALTATDIATLATPPATSNQAPIAEAGSHPDVTTDTLVQLDGSASSDPDSGPQALSYSWSQTGGTAVSMSGANTATPSFTPSVADTYTFELTVSDGVDQSSDTVSLTVTASSSGDILTGLIAHWSFDGSADDASGSGHAASLQNGASYGAGQFGQALQLDGSNDYAIIGPGSTGFLHDAFSDRTLALWIATTSSSGERVLIDEGGSTNGITLRLNGGSLELAARNGGSGNQFTVSTAYPNDGAWHHVAATFANGDLRLYLDGVEVGQTTASYSTVNSHGSIGLLGAADSDAFGAPGGSISDYFTGSCDEVRVYNRALTATDIATLGTPPAGGGNQAPVANAGPNQTVTDLGDDGSESVSLNGSGSSDADGTITTYAWESSLDGALGGGATPTVSLSVGDHTITLTVTDDDGATATDTVQISVESDAGGVTPGEQAVSVAAAKDKVNKEPLKGCKNGDRVKCCKENDPGNCRMFLVTNNKEPCPDGWVLSANGSLIDKTGFNHMHIAKDWQVGASESSCSSCSSGPSTGARKLPGLRVRRIHRYREAFLFWSSLGPGVFLDWDQLIQFSGNDTTGVNAVVFDVHGMRQSAWRETTNYHGDSTIDGVLWNRDTNAAGALRLYSDANWSVPTTMLSNLQTAMLRTHDGFKAYFEVFVDCAADPNTEHGVKRIGRLARYEDPNGNALVIDHVHPVTTPLTDCTKYWQISTVTDAYNRQAVITYKSTQVAGRWVIETIDLPDDTTLTYSYDAAGLTGVTLGNGETASISKQYDADTQCTQISYDDPACDSIHRRKDAYLSVATWTNPDDPQDIRNQTSERLRLVVNGNNEVGYLAWDNNQHQEVFTYEGGQGLAWFKWTGSGSLDGLPKFDKVATEWDITQPVSSYVWETRFDYNSATEPARITKRTDNLGREWGYGWNKQKRVVTRVTHPDQSEETMSYDDFNQVLEYNDRLGRITKNTYDANGNLLSRTKAFGKTEASTEYFTYDTPTKQKDSYTDANGNVTNFTYDLNHFPDLIQQPKDFAADATRPTIDFDFDDVGRLVKETDAQGRATHYLADVNAETLGYDARNRLTHITYADGSQEITTYGTGTDANLIVSRRDRNGNETRYAYDAAGREVSRTVAFGTSEAVVTTRVFQGGTRRPDSITRQGVTTTVEFDYDDRVIASHQHVNATTVLTTRTLFDATRRRIGSIDPYGRRSYMVYDPERDFLVRTVQETVPDAIDVALSLSGALPTQQQLLDLNRDLSPNAAYLIHDQVFDVAGQVVKQVDGRGIISTTTYDCQGRRITTVASAATVPATATYAEIAAGTAETIITDPRIARRTEYDYDGHGNVEVVRHPRWFVSASNDPEGAGQTVTMMTYNGRNLLATRTKAAGSDDAATMNRSYHLDGTLASESNYRGHVTEYFYEACCKRLFLTKDPELAVDGTEPGRLRLSDSYGNTVYTGVLSDVPDPTALMGGETCGCGSGQTAFDAPDGTTMQETTTRYDARHRPIGRTVWLIPLDAFAPKGPSSGIPLAQRATGLPQVTGATHAYQNGSGDIVGLTTTWVYDDNLTDTSGLSDTYASYVALAGLDADSDGYGMAVTNPAGETNVSFMDGAGRTVLTIDAEGNATQTIFDAVVPDSVGDDLLQVTRIVDPDRSGHTGLKLTTRSRSDAAGRTREAVDAESNITKLAYDANSNRVQTRDPNDIGEDCVFDAANRRIVCTDTYNDTTWAAYDAHNNVVRTMDAEGVNDQAGGYDPDFSGAGTTSCIFDPRDRKISCTDRIAALTTYTYDDDNNLLTITDAEGGLTAYVYDERSLLIREEFPTHVANTEPGEAGNDARTYAYDAVRRLGKRVDQSGDATHYVYDFASRMLYRRYPDGQDDAFSYDDASRLLTADSARYTVLSGRTYFPDGTLETETLTINGSSYTISYGYDAANRQDSVTYPGATAGSGDDLALLRTFTDRSQLAKLHFDGQWVAGSANADGFTYDLNKRELSRTYANGVATTFTYRQSGSQRDNLVASIQASSPVEANVTHFSYTYDANKRKTYEQDHVSPDYGQHFEYDDEDRLTKWWRDGSAGDLPEKQDWTLTPVGDWDETTYDQGLPSEVVDGRNHNAVHEVTATSIPAAPGHNNFRHDWKGNMTYNARRDQTYDWDYDNRLQRAYNPALADATVDPEAYWVFNGSTVDISQHGHDGSLNGGATLQATAGRHGSGALRLNGGSSDAVLIGDADEINGEVGQRSVLLWFKLDTGALSASGKQVLFEEGGSSRGLSIYLSGGQLYAGGWNDEASESAWSGTFFSTAALTEGAWHHVALVLDGTAAIHPTSLRAYLDGTEFGVGAGSQLWGHGAVSIGGLSGSTRFHDGTDTAGVTSLDGWIDDCLLSNHALGPAAISTAAERAVLIYQLDSANAGSTPNTAVTGSLLDGSLNGGAQIVSDTGHRAGGLDTTGSTSARVLIPNDALLNLGVHDQRTVSLFFKLETGALAASDGTHQVLYEEGGTSRGLNIYIADGLLYVGGWNTPSSESGWAGSYISTDLLGENRWHHVVLTLDGSSTVQNGALRGYLDGTLFGSAAGSQLWSRSGDINLGGPSGDTLFHDGAGTGVSVPAVIDSLVIANDAVSPAWIADASATSSYCYDALGRRVAKRTGGRERVFLCGMAQVFSEYVDGELERSYVYGTYVDEPVAIVNANGGRYFYSRNSLYSAAALTDAMGAVVDLYGYDSYGERVLVQGKGLQDYGFTGRRLDAESDMWYFRARYFDSEVGRFVARDPQYLDGYSLYGAYFVPNYLDTYGMSKCAPHQVTVGFNDNGTLGPFPIGSLGPIPLFQKVDYNANIQVEGSFNKCKRCCEDGSQASIYNGSASVSGNKSLRVEWYGQVGSNNFGVSAGIFASGQVTLSGGGSVSADCCKRKCSADIQVSVSGTLEVGGFVRGQIKVWKVQATVGAQVSGGVKVGGGFGLLCDNCRTCEMTPIFTLEGFVQAKVYAAAEVGWFTIEYSRTWKKSLGGNFGGGTGIKISSPFRSLCSQG